MDIFEKMRNLDEFIQISLLSEYYFCKRRCSLLLLEGRSTINTYMVEGEIQHSKVHSSKIEKRVGITKIFNLQIFSNNYSMIGKMDCLECLDDKNGPYIDILGGNYSLLPVEYKHGIVRDEEEYEVQLCAQALCLEEMYNTKIDKGILYYIGSNERVEVFFTDDLRQKVLFGVVEIFDIINNSKMHEPIYKRRCSKCSLYEKCNPKINNVNKYISDIWREIE